MQQETLELELGTQFRGIEEAKEYAKALSAVARAETRAAKAIKEASQAMKELPPASSLPAPPAPAPKVRAMPMGPHQRLLRAGDDFDRAKESGDTAQIADAHYALRRAEARVEQAQRGAMSPTAQALYSTRINLPGGAAPLLGKTLEGALGKDKAIGIIEEVSAKIGPMASKFLPLVGGLSVATKASIAVGRAMYSAAEASSQATRQLTDQRAQSGSSTSDVVRMNLMGADPGAARGFNDRIASDPVAMAAAGSVGVSNLKAPYGSLDFGKTYLAAIERVSKIGDESQRRRLSLILGIEQEVARYSLLSERTRRNLKDSAAQSARINDPAAERQSAEFKAAQDRVAQASQGFTSAASQLFTNDITNLLNLGASALEKVSGLVKGTGDFARSLLLDTFAGPLAPAILGLTGTGPKKEASAIDTNNQLLASNTEALQRLTQNIGQTARSREATDRFRTLGGATGYAQGLRAQFSFGALG